MGLFNKDKGTTGNSGIGGMGFTISGTASKVDHRRAETMRREWTGPRKGDLAARQVRRSPK